MTVRRIAAVLLLLTAGCCKCERETSRMLERRIEKLERRLTALEAQCRNRNGFSSFKVRPSAGARATELPNARRPLPASEDRKAERACP